MSFHNPPISTFLLPSLWRFDRLLESVRSIFETCHGANNIEVVIRLHLSDTEAYQRARELFEIDPLRIKVIWGDDKPVGTSNEWLWNDLLKHALGAWLQFWSDDLILHGKGWDTMLINTPTEGFLCQPEIHRLNHSIYLENMDGPAPFVPREAMKLFHQGRLPKLPDVACYDLLVKHYGWKVKFLPGIEVQHNRINDRTLAVSYAHEI